MNRKSIAILAAATVLLLGSCSDAASNDRDATNSQLEKYQKVQPVPNYDYSQYRQTVIDILAAQVGTVATTTFMFNYGADPIDSCPSIGFPIPSTAQLTSPDQRVAGYDTTVSQSEPNGVYTGSSSGTYVVCVASDGTKYIDYWEGNVKTTGGPAHWDYTNHRVVLDGKPTTTTK